MPRGLIAGAATIAIWAATTLLAASLGLNDDACATIQHTSIGFKGLTSLMVGCFW